MNERTNGNPICDMPIVVVIEIRQCRITWLTTVLPSRQQQVTPGCHTGVLMAFDGEWHEPPLV
jgi:hypothetical protein